MPLPLVSMACTCRMRYTLSHCTARSRQVSPVLPLTLSLLPKAAKDEMIALPHHVC